MIQPSMLRAEPRATITVALVLVTLTKRHVVAGDGITRLEDTRALDWVARQEETRVLEYRILEEQPPNTLIADIVRDSGLDTLYNAQTRRAFKYHLLSVQLTAPSSSVAVNRSVDHLFAVDSWTGILRTSVSVDRESICPRAPTCSFRIDFSVVPAMYFRVIKVIVDVVDINDNAPRFNEDPLTIDVNELTPSGTSYPLPDPVDLDSGSYGLQGYRLSVERGEDSLFELRVLNGSAGSVELFLVLLAQLDREVKARHSVVVTAFDGGIPRLSGALTVEMSVTDANDNSPRFDRSTYEFAVYEDAPVGTTIGGLDAHDADTGPNAEIVYTLTRSTLTQHGHLFRVDPKTGHLIVTAPLDYERCAEFSLGVMASDSGHVPLSDYAKVFVRVLDVNDHAPQISVNSLMSDGVLRIPENAPLGSFVAHLSITDRDTPGHVQVTCGVAPHSDFALSQTGPSEYKVTSARSFDREVGDEHVVAVTCEDHGQPNLVTSTEVVVHVTDENDCVPEFSEDTYTIRVFENDPAGTVLGRVEASDCDDGVNAQVTYSLLGKTPLVEKEEDSKQALSVDPRNGTLRSALTFDYETQRLYEFLVVATDSGRVPLSSTSTVNVVVLDVNDEAPRFLELNHTFHLTENLEGVADVGRVVAVDDDDYPFNQIHYSIRSVINAQHRFESTYTSTSSSFSSSSSSFHNSSSSANSSNPSLPSYRSFSSFYQSWPFNIDSTTGLIRAHGPLDRELFQSYRIVVEARNDGFPQMSATTDVILHVDDVNDNAPSMLVPSKANETFPVSRGTKAGDMVLCISAEDKDSGLNAQIDYLISTASGVDLEIFNIEPLTGCLAARRDLSSFAGQRFPLVVVATDRGTPPLLTACGLILVVNETVDAWASLFPFLGEQSWTTLVIISIPLSTLVVSTALVICLLLRARRVRQRRDRWNAKYGGQVELNDGNGGYGPRTLNSTSSRFSGNHIVADRLDRAEDEEDEERRMEEDSVVGGTGKVGGDYNDGNWIRRFERASHWNYRLPV